MDFPSPEDRRVKNAQTVASQNWRKGIAYVYNYVWGFLTWPYRFSILHLLYYE